MLTKKFTLRLIDLVRSLINALIDDGYPDIAFRNLKIELDYHEMVLKGKSPKDVKSKVAADYFLSQKSIEKIIYKRQSIK